MMYNLVQRLPLDIPSSKDRFVLQQNSFARKGCSKSHVSFVDLEFFRTRARDFQADRDIIRNVVTADRKHSALFNCSIDINDKIGSSSADIDQDCSQLFLVFFQNGLSRRKRVDDHIGRLEFQFFYTTNLVLNPSADSINDVKIRLQFLPQQTDRIEDSVLPIDVVVLNNRVENAVFHR